MKFLSKTVDFKGVVQGVGFRPAISRLANEAGLTGWIRNEPSAVRAQFVGAPDVVNGFLSKLPGFLPQNAALESMIVVAEATVEEVPEGAFVIVHSKEGERPDPVVPADLAVCPDCIAEIEHPDDRRYTYPFTTCVNCGPRYTVLTGMPYDRQRTTMSGFSMCEECKKEYEDLANRRFHAEAIACPACGPQLTLYPPLPGDPLINARKALANGQIIGVRGVGGFHIALDAFNRLALEHLRLRKMRPHKPFALMADSLETVRRFCVCNEDAARLLLSASSPIVILDVKKDVCVEKKLPLDLITPDADTIGMMLPTTPLHHLLFCPHGSDKTPPLSLLVMTSGNRRSEPVSISNDDAVNCLSGIADVFLLHNREIALRNDDSLCVLQESSPQVWRRSRGYAPAPESLAWHLTRTVLAMGAEIKNTVALGFENRVVISPHIGDLETPEAVSSLRVAANRLPYFFNRKPEIIAVDAHPDMHSTRVGREIAVELGVPLVEIQHHAAHSAACLAEHGEKSGLVLVFDGTGLGTDGTIWGAELFYLEDGKTKRLATFLPTRLPGGDAAVTQPVRQLVARLIDSGVDVFKFFESESLASQEDIAVWQQQCYANLNAPFSHSAGRLFDSFSVMLGFAPERVTYDGQSAIRLEAAAARYGETHAEKLPFSCIEKDDLFFIDWTLSFRMLADMTSRKDKAEELAMSAHYAIADAAIKMIEYGMVKTGRDSVGLSGGVFMNRILNRLVLRRLKAAGVKALVHSRVPPNDGCISFGQAVIAGG